MNKQLVFDKLAHYWTHDMPFNQLLGFRITRFDATESELRFHWQDKLIGNPMQQILHGGVTASALDLIGGVVAAANIIDQLEQLSDQAVMQSLTKLGTIDLRTDYLRPGRGTRIYCHR